MPRLRLQRRPSIPKKSSVKINRSAAKTASRKHQALGQMEIGPVKLVKTHLPAPTKQRSAPIQWDLKNNRPLK